jgi:UDP-N-acetylglucosamine diphosphorylase / glucose-1-phosphate thymidylyltransferase / UDP-N-acetylgalactosamine diphosphorylase / glucosamine-1-phosphate N-acetyltransferase / galactosamine-1-phosphate N-acetyltransferase
MKQAVVLAAGEGQRLRPFTANKSKVMLGIAGKPILQYVIEALAQNGIREVVVVVGYKREQIFDHFETGKDLGVNITYVTQGRQLGTAHALMQARQSIKGEFLVLPGDNLIYGDTIKEIASAAAPAVLLKHVADASGYGIVEVEDGRIQRIEEKPTQHTSDAVNVGIYAFEPGIFDLIDQELNLPDVINLMVKRGTVVHPYFTDGTWLDVVYPWDLVRLNGAVLATVSGHAGGTIEAGVYLKGQVSIGKDSIVRSNSYIMGPVVIGEHCDIGPNVCILPSTSIGDNVSIGPFTTIENSIIGNDVGIGTGSTIQDSVIDEGSIIRGHMMASSGLADVAIEGSHRNVRIGAMLGTGCEVGNGVVAEPGSILGNYCRVQAMKLVHGTIPDRALIL